VILRLLNGALMLMAAASVATLLSQAVLVSYLWSAWDIDQDKIVQMLAIAQGVDLFAIKEEIDIQRDEIAEEQMSYEDVLKQRALDIRHIELREESLSSGISQLDFEARRLVEERKRYDQIKQGFETTLATLTEGAKAEGLAENRRALESIKPEQAKAQLLIMLNNDEMDDVVLLLAEMVDVKRSKILSEFESPEEMEKLAEILRRIREGYPEVPLAEDALNGLAPVGGT
jgi:hypothetical protein